MFGFAGALLPQIISLGSRERSMFVSVFRNGIERLR
jgi:hypothetical protein